MNLIYDLFGVLVSLYWRLGRWRGQVVI